VEWADYALILVDTMLQDIVRHLPNVAGWQPKRISPSTSFVPSHMYCVSFQVLLNLARVLFNLQYLDDAIYLTRRSLEVQPPDKNAWQQYFTLGEIFKVLLHTCRLFGQLCSPQIVRVLKCVHCLDCKVLRSQTL